MKKLIQTDRPGFTLIEMLISLGIFMMFMSAILGSYIQISTLQQKTNLKRENIAETREVLDYITQKAKEKAIDYSCYQSATCPNGFVGNTVEEISLISKDGLDRTIIRKQFDSNTQETYLSSEEQHRDTPKNQLWTSSIAKRLHSPNLKFQNITFQISPNQDPFSDNLSVITNNALQYQPILHINLNLKRNNSENPEPIIFETSISSRLYHTP